MYNVYVMLLWQSLHNVTKYITSSDLSILIHGVMSLTDTTPCDKLPFLSEGGLCRSRKQDVTVIIILNTCFIIFSQKAVSQAINSHVLTGKNPCINQAIHMLLMHIFCTLHIRILGHHKH